jgi:hypothetical protein
MSSYQEEVQRKEAVAAASVQESANRAAFSLICDHFPLADTVANFKMLIEWCDGEISVSKFQALVDLNPQGFTLDFTGSRDKLLAEIVNELDPSGARLTQQDLNTLFARRANGENVRIDQIVIGKSHNIDTEIKRLQFATKAALRARLAELRYAREVKAKSSADLRADLAAHRDLGRGRYHPYPDLPPEVTAEEIKKSGVHKIKFLGQKYGREQVNARLNGVA